MSIHSGYVDVFLDRIKRIAATGLDGIWLDVPLFSELGAAWPDAGPAAAAKFLADTGLQVPRAVDWDDPVWRRWIAWRYQRDHELPAARARRRAVGLQRHQHRGGDRHARLRPCHAGRPRRQPAEGRPRHHPGLGSRRGQRPDRDARGVARRLDQPHRHGEVRARRVRRQTVLDVRLRRSARRQPAGDGGGAGGRQQSVRDQDPEDDRPRWGRRTAVRPMRGSSSRSGGCSPAAPARRSRCISRPRAATISTVRSEPASTP